MKYENEINDYIDNEFEDLEKDVMRKINNFIREINSTLSQIVPEDIQKNPDLIKDTKFSVNSEIVEDGDEINFIINLVHEDTDENINIGELTITRS